MKEVELNCCQPSTSTTPENSIVEDDEIANNNTMFNLQETDSATTEKITFVKNAAVDDFEFPKRPKVDVEFQNLKYTVNQFSFQNRKFGEYKSASAQFSFTHFLFFIFN